MTARAKRYVIRCAECGAMVEGRTEYEAEVLYDQHD